MQEDNCHAQDFVEDIGWRRIEEPMEDAERYEDDNTDENLGKGGEAGWVQRHEPHLGGAQDLEAERDQRLDEQTGIVRRSTFLVQDPTLLPLEVCPCSSFAPAHTLTAFASNDERKSNYESGRTTLTFSCDPTAQVDTLILCTYIRICINIHTHTHLHIYSREIHMYTGSGVAKLAGDFEEPSFAGECGGRRAGWRARRAACIVEGGRHGGRFEGDELIW